MIILEDGDIGDNQLSTDFEMKTRTVIDEYATDHLTGISTGKERERQLKRILHPFMNRAFKSITQRELTQSLNRWSGPTRNRYRSALTHLFRWGRAHGYTTLAPTLLGAKEIPRDHVMTMDMLRRLYAAADRRGAWGAYGKMLILTGQRRGDLMRMLPQHIDNKTAQWNQPTSKNGMPHIVPLTERMRNIISNEWELDRFSWTGKTTFSDFKRRWFKDANVPSTFRLHDIRRAFATHLAEAGNSPDVIDRHLNHQASATSRGVARVYNRASMLKQRKRLMHEWDELLFS